MSQYEIVWTLCFVGGWALIIGLIVRAQRARERDLTRRTLDQTPLTSASTLLSGQTAKVGGVVESQTETLLAPLSGRACVAYAVLIQRPGRGGPITELDERRALAFSLRDGDQSVRVKPDAFLLDLTPSIESDSGWSFGGTPEMQAKLEALLAPRGATAESWLGGIRSLIWREMIVEVGARIEVIARCDADADGRALVSPGERPMMLGTPSVKR